MWIYSRYINLLWEFYSSKLQSFYGLDLSKEMFQSPLEFLFFQTKYINELFKGASFQSPLGFLFFQTVMPWAWLQIFCSNPLWGFCSSKQAEGYDYDAVQASSNPLWGFCSSKHYSPLTKEFLNKFQSPLGFLLFQTKMTILL